MGDEGGVLWEDGVLTGLSDGLLDGDLTIGAFVFSCSSTSITESVLTDTGLTCGFSTALDFFSGLTSGFFGFTCDFISVFVLDFGPLSTSLSNGKTTGINFLFVMPSGVSLLL